MKVKVAQSCPTLCNPMDYTVHGILQARILEWVAISFSRGSSQPRDQTQVSPVAGGFFPGLNSQERPYIKYYSAIKIKELIFCDKLGGPTMYYSSEISQVEKNIHCIILLICGN